MPVRLVASVVLLPIVLAACLTVSAQQNVLRGARVEMTGTIRSTSPGIVVLDDESGSEHTFKIQAKDQPGISVAGASTIVAFPATVHISGKLDDSALVPGTLVRFTTQLNRLGRTRGELDQILVFDDKAHTLGIEVVQEPEKLGDYGTCTISGEVFSYRDERLVVTIPATSYVRKPRLSFRVAKNVPISIESSDYRRAERGDRVTHLLGLRFESGESLIKELQIQVDRQNAETNPSRNTTQNAYRQLSDAPKPPRDLRSANFLLHTDISDRSARVLLDRLETMVLLVSHYYGRPATQIIECYVVRDLQNWPPGMIPQEAIAKIAEPAGVTLSMSLGRQKRSVVYACDKHGVVQHEAIHAYCFQTFGDTGPTWYAEGMAEMGQYWKQNQPAVEIDPLVIDYLKNAPAKRMLDIVAAGQITGDSWRAYAWRWALCHLLASNPNYADRFKTLGLGMMSQHPGASFESVYGNVAREISFEYDQFVRCLDNGYRVDLCVWQWNRKFQYIVGKRYAQTTVKAKYGWQASAVKLKAGQAYDYVAKGNWTVEPNNAELTADGNPRGEGRLVGVVFRDFQLSDPLELGQQGSLIAPSDGDLYLRCAEPWNRLSDNDGGADGVLPTFLEEFGAVIVKRLDLTLPTPAENLALDEALLDEAESSPEPLETLRLWEMPQPVVVVGRSSRVAQEVDQTECARRGVPVLRRCSGGASVVAGPGCLMYSVVLSYRLRPQLAVLDHAHQLVMRTALAALQDLGLDVLFQGTCDLTVAERKFSGNSLRCKRTHLLYHGTFLYNFPLELISACLRTPPRQPRYREQRSHDAFVTNLAVDPLQLRHALARRWGAASKRSLCPTAEVAELTKTRYQTDSWNLRH